MILFAILTGIVVVFIWRRITNWSELLILTSWGLLAAGTPIGRIPAEWLAALSGWVNHMFGI